MFLSMDKILQNASKGNYGIPAPNVFDLETVAGAFESAIEVRSPLIIDCLERIDLEAIAELVKFYSKRFPEIPVALNLDHGITYGGAVKAIRAGFTSVMIDRSQASFVDNVRETKEIVKMAHAVGVSVEAELGHVGMGTSYVQQDSAAMFTQVEEAVRYVQETEIDCLAVAVGTAHGRYAGVPKIDFQRLVEIRSNIAVPLVLHGGSSTGDDNLVKAIKSGIRKVNISTDLWSAGLNEVRKIFAQEEFPHLIDVNRKKQDGYKLVLKHYMTLFGSNGKF